MIAEQLNFDVTLYKYLFTKTPSLKSVHDFFLFIYLLSLNRGYRLWQDAEERVLLTKELDRITGQVLNLLLMMKFAP